MIDQKARKLPICKKLLKSMVKGGPWECTYEKINSDKEPVYSNGVLKCPLCGSDLDYGIYSACP